MSLSPLPLGYCTNVHPGRTVAEVLEGLDRYTVPVRERLGRPIAAGLWLARPVVDELLITPDGVARLAEALESRGLACYTLNAFPYGDFHAARVKEQVYLPDWATEERAVYTVECAAVLSELLPEGGEGSISTLPLGFKGFDHSDSFLARCAGRLSWCAANLAKLREMTGRTIRLAIEPEPFCLLETTAEAIAFFERLWQHAGRDEPAVREHIGLCYDVCHQAVEFEDAAESIRSLDRAGVRINKVQISCALQLDSPGTNADGRDSLRPYIEPRYLHQTFARQRGGGLLRAVDLADDLFTNPDFLAADCWRVHFHVPVDAERLGPLSTTRFAVADALAAIAKLSYAPHLEVETYTWSVLPGVVSPDLVEGLVRELKAAETMMERQPRQQDQKV